MMRPPPIATRTDSLVAYTTVCRAGGRLLAGGPARRGPGEGGHRVGPSAGGMEDAERQHAAEVGGFLEHEVDGVQADGVEAAVGEQQQRRAGVALHRSEEHTSELQSLMRISYAVFCLKKKTTNTT